MKYEQRRGKTRNLGGYPISLDLLSCFPEIPTKCSFQTLGICPFRARNKVEKDFEGVIWNSLMDLSRELMMRVWVLKHVKLCSTYSSVQYKAEVSIMCNQRAKLGPGLGSDIRNKLIQEFIF